MKKYIIGAIAALSLCGISCTQSDYVPDGIATGEKAMFETESKLDELLSIAEAPQRSKEEVLAIASRFVGVVTRAGVSPSSQFELTMSCRIGSRTPMEAMEKPPLWIPCCTS